MRDPQDAEAWQEFFELYSPLLYGFARGCGLSHEDAEDIRASCYETIVKKISDFEYDRSNSGFRAWLRTLVNRRVIDFLRKKKLKSADSSDLREIRDGSDLPDEIWEKNWRLHHLRYCVALVGKKVSPKSFEAFRLLTEHDCSVEEVCLQLEMNKDQVYKIKSRFLALVREEMKEFDLET